jgi:protein arginine kinase
MSIRNIIEGDFVKWMDLKEADPDIVISSRVRLARNLRNIPFPHLLDETKGTVCIDTIRHAWQSSAENELGRMDMETFDNVSALDRQILMEKHLSSPQQANSSVFYSGILINDDGSLAVMINEEDHLRIQCLLPGLQLGEAYRRASGLDDHFEQQLDYAFDERRGYLTACPTNVGTGMRASVMLHLPALQITGQTNNILHNVSQLGMAVRGLYGEGTEAIGNLFQLSNQVTMGQSEEDIYSYLQTITLQVVDQKKILRERLKAEMIYQLEDKVGRAYGILTNARVINSKEPCLCCLMCGWGWIWAY